MGRGDEYSHQACRMGPIDYLSELQSNASRVQEDLSQWLPWNEREQPAGQ